jgi:hypothetical protein
MQSHTMVTAKKEEWDGEWTGIIAARKGRVVELVGPSLASIHRVARVWARLAAWARRRLKKIEVCEVLEALPSALACVAPQEDQGTRCT